MNNEYIKILEEYQNDLAPEKGKVKDILDTALNDFKEVGLPTRKLESWKFSNLEKFLDPVFLPHETDDIVQADDINQFAIDSEAKLVFINGTYNVQHSSLPQGLKISHLKTKKDWQQTEVLAYEEKDSLEIFNTLSLSEVLLIELDKNVSMKTPLSILHLSTVQCDGGVAATRVFVKLADNSALDVYECFAAIGGHEQRRFTSSFTKFVLQNGANASHAMSMIDNSNSVHIGHTHADIAKDANFQSFTFSTGGSFNRNNVKTNINGEGAHADVHGLFTLKNNQHCDNYTQIIHNAANTTSDQLFKGLVTDTAHGVFTGKIVIEKNAQKVASEQLSKNLLLDPKAHVDTCPQLIINADDVTATHGATVGQIDEEQLFYLETRGINKSRAKELLCQAFVADAIFKIRNEKIKNKLRLLLNEELLDINVRTLQGKK
jgi:Fe-S cluster assembly protein SufD